ncbi:MAG: helix-turn-helix transcriptional regulator, partial [Candidatus Dormibacteraeota bacterium]|nr:helix-turn-helix transcriptional regulator [Candidatus Dormibacteraeota bacterium]
ADHAGVGKGTIYLHWRTREALFNAVIERESLAVFDDVVAALRADPEVALLHRLLPALFLHLMRRPLLRAAYVGDLELLGKLAKQADRQLEARGDQAFARYVEVLLASGLVRSDLRPADLLFALQATIRGYFVQEEPVSDAPRVPLERQAELLAMTVRQTFESPEHPSAEAVRAIAPQVVETYEEIAGLVRAHLAQAYT